MSIAQRIADIHSDVAAACIEAGRKPHEVRVLGACKTKPVELIREALSAGQTLLAENRAQELRDKAPLLAAYDPAPEWHFIGRLQKNKVKYVVPWAQIVHTVDSFALAEEIARRTPGPIGVLIQVNAAHDPAKAGVSPNETLALCKQVEALDNITVRGLMTIPPMTEDPESCAPFFAEVTHLAQMGQAAGLQTDILSMGMSRDYRVAIREGSTLIRVGTAIFGSRD
ncbi:MAG: YggS family pyridoxal phosphate-dependent enzyme [Deltaproteobacteria bacterium]|nr:YggS family pyridoxal phosphate-dependent enzyme [Deltaproteobacteria bacterium]